LVIYQESLHDAWLTKCKIPQKVTKISWWWTGYETRRAQCKIHNTVPY